MNIFELGDVVHLINKDKEEVKTIFSECFTCEGTGIAQLTDPITKLYVDIQCPCVKIDKAKYSVSDEFIVVRKTTVESYSGDTKITYFIQRIGQKNCLRMTEGLYTKKDAYAGVEDLNK